VTSWDALRSAIAQELAVGGITSAQIEARWITEHVSGARGVEWAECAGHAAPNRLQIHANRLVERRVAGEPLQYVLGEWAFRDLDVAVDSRVLIPRPETEWVVEIALQEAQRSGLRRGAPRQFGAEPTEHVADLGTGSGVIAISLERELPDTTVWACDVSAEALALARRNAIGNAAGRVRTAHGSWFEAIPGHLRGELSLVVSNPPYIAESEFSALPPEVREHEPYAALISGPSGTEAIEVLVLESRTWLRPGCALVCEIGATQGDVVLELVERTGGYDSAEVHRDLADRPRVLVARRSRRS
jgi:release factor glutamine methyltransferase